MTLFAFRLSFLLLSICKNFFTGTLEGSLSRQFRLQTGNLAILLTVNLKGWLIVSINFPPPIHNFWSVIVPQLSSTAFKEGVVGIKRAVSFSNARSKKSGSLSLCSKLFVRFGDLFLLISSVRSFTSEELSLSSEELSQSSKELSLSFKELCLSSEELFFSSEELSFSSEEHSLSSKELSLSSEELFLSSEELSLSSQELSLSSEELSLSSEELSLTLKGIFLKKLCNIGNWESIDSRHSLTEREMLVNQKP